MLNPEIFCFNDIGTVPKLFTIILFGLNYWAFGNFYVLTFISIILNSLANAFIIKWVNKTNGSWIFASLFLMLNISWIEMVINADNLAFSYPFLFIGLYKYFYKNEKGKGLILLLISTMFRPGYEAVFLFLIIYELFKRNYKIHWLVVALIISSIHTLFGYKLGFCEKESFYSTCINFVNEPILYKNSLLSFYPYFTTIFNLVFYQEFILPLLFLPAIIGIINILKQKSNIIFVLISFLTTLIVPVSVFYYGNSFFIQPQQVIILTFLFPIIASYWEVDILKFIKLNYLTCIGLLVFIVFVLGLSGNFRKRNYEANPNYMTSYKCPYNNNPAGGKAVNLYSVKRLSV